jgi:hypothetical protein
MSRRRRRRRHGAKFTQSVPAQSTSGSDTGSQQSNDTSQQDENTNTGS